MTARRLSDSIFDTVCGCCTGAARRGIQRAREAEEGNEQPRDAGEAIYDGLCATCSAICALAFCRFSQYELESQNAPPNVPERSRQAQNPPPPAPAPPAPIPEGVVPEEMSPEARRRAEQAARMEAFLGRPPKPPPPSFGSLASVPEGGVLEVISPEARRRAEMAARSNESLNRRAQNPPPLSSKGEEEEEEEEGVEEVIQSSSSTGVAPPPGPPELPAFFTQTTVGIPLMYQSLPMLPLESSPSEPQPEPTPAKKNIEPWAQTDEFPFPYGRLQLHGQQRREWIENPQVPGCPINPTTLTIQQLETEHHYSLPPVLTTIDPDFAQQVLDLGLSADPVYWSLHMRTNDFTFHGECGPTQAFYTRNFEMNTLRHVFVQHIINEETAPFVKDLLYSENNINRRGLSWPASVPQVWDYGTPEYDGLIGSRIGKFVAYLVLSAFLRGTRRIARIETWASVTEIWDHRLHIRFDIELVGTA
ncbi:unnamed protein product [Penicillium manginii]